MEQEIAMSNSKTLNCLIFLQSFLLINTVIFANIGIKKTKSNFCLKIIAKLDYYGHLGHLMTTLNYSTLFHFTFAVEFKFMSHLNDSTMKRRILFSVMCAVIAASVFAQGQGQGLAGINAATSLMTSYFDPATKLCYAIGAVLGLVGGIKTYGKFSSGDPDTSKTAASWFFACIFLIVAATILRSFFL